MSPVTDLSDLHPGAPDVDLVSALVYWTTWVHRRVEAVELLEGERARRRVSVDLTVLPIAAPGLPEQVVVPLATAAKRTMRRLDVVDDTGRSLPILGAEDNGVLSAAFLADLIASETGEVDDQLREALQEVVQADAPVAARVAAGLVRRYGLAGTLSQEFLVRLAHEFVLFALLPAERAGSRLVVKYSYHWETNELAMRTSGWQRVAASLGLRPYPVALEISAVDTAASVHIEIPAPPGLRCVDMVVSDDDEGGVLVRDDGGGTVAHAHARFGPMVRYVTATARFDPDRAGLHRMITWAAFGIAVLFVTTGLRLGAVASSPPGTPVSLLLFAPALLLTWLVRPGESALVARVVGPLRVVAIALATLLFLAGVALATEAGSPTSAPAGVVTVCWWVGATVSLVAGTVLAVGSFCIGRRARSGGARDER